MISIWFPILFTIFAFYVASSKAPPSGDYGAGAVIAVGYLMIACIVSLLAWLGWALL